MVAESVPASPDAPDDDAPGVGVPPVVAVVVTHDPGAWLGEVLTALAGQDYPNLSVLVIDAASAVDPTSQVAAILPGAFIRRLDTNVGFAAAANEVLGIVEGASHYVFLHDDAAPESDTIRLLVEEAYRSNAGVVAPKYVRWDDPTELLAVGMAADKSGVTTPFGRRELDQEQYDAVVDVFAAPGGCTLVRADLFATLHGFDPVMTQFGEDLDLSWRAQLLGARVVVAPAARVRHLEATVARHRPPYGATDTESAIDITRLERRHRLRSVFKNYGLIHLIRVIPQVAVLHVVEFFVAIVTGERALAGAIASPWRSTFRRSGLRAARRATQSHRAVPDAELRRLQARGSARLRVALQGGLAVEERTLGVGAAGRQLAGSLRQGGLRLTLAVWFGIALVMLVGSRDLLGGRLPAVGQFAPFPHSPGLLLTSFLSGWRTNGLGSTAPAPFSFALLAGLGALLAGGMGLVQKVLVLGALPVGVIGIFRLTLPLGSWRARLVAATLYAANPLPYDALRNGSWAGLVAYGAMPWILSRVFAASAVAPFGARAPLEDVLRRRRAARRPSRPMVVEDIEAVLGAEAGTLDPLDAEEQRLVTALVEGVHHGASDDGFVARPVAAGREVAAFHDQWVPLAILLAVTAALAPAVAIAALVGALGLLAGSVVVGDTRGGARSLGVAAAATGAAMGLLFPWSLDFVLPGSAVSAVIGLGPPVHRAFSLAALLRFDTGPTGGSVLGWAPLLAALLPLLIARRWRLTAATRLWFVALASWGFAWVAGRGWLGIPPPAIDVFVMPAAVAVATAAALGLAAFEADLREYRFGWRQGASVAALVAGLVALVPVVVASTDGAWHAPRRDFVRLLGWMTEHRKEGAFRVLWVGDPKALPLDGWRLDDRLAFGTSRDGPPDASALWPSADVGTSGLLADAIGVARRGETSRLGHLLAPMAVRYVALPLASAPGRSASSGAAATGASSELPVPADLTAALEAQTDLRQIETDSSLVVYENAAWGPGREVLPPDALPASAQAGPEATRALELVAARAVLPKQKGPADFTGAVPAGEIYIAEASSSHWRLDVAGAHAPRRRAFGWANAFTVADPGQGRARFQTPLIRPAVVLIELAAWVAALRALVGIIRRRRAVGDELAVRSAPTREGD